MARAMKKFLQDTLSNEMAWRRFYRIGFKNVGAKYTPCIGGQIKETNGKTIIKLSNTEM